jgi:hypothetical protein
MKKFANLPIYFIIGGLILNLIMFSYNKVTFTNLMIRSSIIIILFAATGYFFASILRAAQEELSKPKNLNNVNKTVSENTGSMIDIRVNSDDDDELLNLMPISEDEEFSEISINNFKRIMEQDRY